MLIKTVGVGGVGSWAATMLLRSGVRRLRIIDFDQVTLSSLNRHAVATRAEVGSSKVKAIKEYLLKIFPDAEIQAENRIFNAESAQELLQGSPDWVLDCIDNIDTKLELLKYCHVQGIRVISSMGAGGKCDPSRIQIADISETLEDGLARAVRLKLRKLGISGGIPVVYSTERPSDIGLLPLDESRLEEAGDFAIVPNFRARIMPVLGFPLSLSPLFNTTNRNNSCNLWPFHDHLCVVRIGRSYLYSQAQQATRSRIIWTATS